MQESSPSRRVPVAILRRKGEMDKHLYAATAGCLTSGVGRGFL